jgi:hypothetical protein
MTDNNKEQTTPEQNFDKISTELNDKLANGFLQHVAIKLGDFKPLPIEAKDVEQLISTHQDNTSRFLAAIDEATFQAQKSEESKQKFEKSLTESKKQPNSTDTTSEESTIREILSSHDTVKAEPDLVAPEEKKTPIQEFLNDMQINEKLSQGFLDYLSTTSPDNFSPLPTIDEKIIQIHETNKQLFKEALGDSKPFVLPNKNGVLDKISKTSSVTSSNSSDNKPKV